MVAPIKPQAPVVVGQAWTPPPQGEWTYDDVMRLPEDGWRYEVIRGELFMTPPPSERHQFFSMRLATRFDNFVTKHKLGRVYAAPIGVVIGDEATPVQPDIVFVSQERIAQVVVEEGLRGAPDLIVEILSPSNWLTDRRDKFQLYQRVGVREYWIVDPKTIRVQVYVLRDGQFVEIGDWGAGEIAHSEILAGFEIAMNELAGVDQ